MHGPRSDHDLPVLLALYRSSHFALEFWVSENAFGCWFRETASGPEVQNKIPTRKRRRQTNQITKHHLPHEKRG